MRYISEVCLDIVLTATGAARGTNGEPNEDHDPRTPG